MIAVFRALGYLTAALRILWRLKYLWAEFMLLAADAGNAWTDKCFTTEEGQKLYQDFWGIMVSGGFTCQHATEQQHGDLGGIPAQQRRTDQVIAPQRVEWPDNVVNPWSATNQHEPGASK